MAITRRALLSGAAAAALAFGLVDCEARPRQVLTIGAASFNGAKVQGAPQVGVGDYPFVDHFKNGQGWGGSGFVDPTTLDPDGWPLSLPFAYSNLMYVPTQAERPGNYYVDWQGNGTVTIAGATLVSGSLTSTTGSGQAIISMASGVNALTVGISAISTPRITKLRVYHQSDVGIVDHQWFSPTFLAFAKNFGVIRFMDALYAGQSSGQGNLTTWSTRKPVSCCHWAAPERRSSIAISGGANYALNGSSNDYSATYGDGVSGPAPKETIIVRCNNTATNTTCTFNKNGTGALPIMSPNGTALTSGNSPVASRDMTLIYDSGFNAWMIWGGNTNAGAIYLTSGWPIEVCMSLCALVGAHPWFTMCQPMFDPITDFPASLATFIKVNYQDTICPWMVPRFEPPNELWNNGFFQTAYGDARQILRNGSTTALNIVSFTYTGSGTSGTSTIKATGASIYPVGATLFTTGAGGLTGWNGNTVYVIATNVGGDPNTVTVNRAPTGGTWTTGGTLQGQANDRHNWYGRAASDLGQAIAGVYGYNSAQAKASTKYKVLVGVQTGTTPAASNDRLAASQYVVLGGQPAYNWVNGICNAQYTSPSARATTAEMGMAWQYNQGDATQPAAYVAGLAGASTVPGTLAYWQTSWLGWAQWCSAAPFNIFYMCGYEGAYSPDYLKAGSVVTCSITGATIDATGCTLTMSNGSMGEGWVAPANNPNGCFDFNCVGLTFTIAGVGGMTQLNGLTATIVSVSGNQVKTNINSSSFSAYTSGGTATVTNGRTLINALRYASKLDPSLKGYTKSNWSNFNSAASSISGFVSEFPSVFIWTGSSFLVNLASPGNAGDGQTWGLKDPDIYATNSPQYNAVLEFNAGI